MFLQESLMMPYTFGLDFVRDSPEQKGKTAAFAGMLEHPPDDTRQVMEPATYLRAKTVTAADDPRSRQADRSRLSAL